MIKTRDELLEYTRDTLDRIERESVEHHVTQREADAALNRCAVLARRALRVLQAVNGPEDGNGAP